MRTIETVFHLLGYLIVIQAFLLLLPLVPAVYYHEYAQAKAFVLSSLLSGIIGLLLLRFARSSRARRQTYRLFAASV